MIPIPFLIEEGDRLSVIRIPLDDRCEEMKIKLREPQIAILFLIPAFVALGIFYYYQIVQTVIYSLHNLQYTGDWMKEPFVGLRNYATVLGDARFWHCLRFTLYFTAMSVFLEFCVGLGMALAAFWVHPRLRSILRAIFTIPWAIPTIISAMIWKWLFHADVGIFGYILIKLGLVSRPPLFLTDRLLAMHSVILADVWKNSSVMAIFLLGGLATIPQDIYDAAKVDGARAWFRFRKITLPMISSTIVVAVLFRSMDSIRFFDLIYGLTGGGPGTTTESISSFAYKYYFSYTNFGLGSAYAIVIILLILVPSFLYIRRILKGIRFKE